MRPLTFERLREVVSYDPETGLFTWIRASNRRVRVGSTAGSLSEGYVEIGIDGHSYKAHRLAWLYVYGSWPVRDIDHLDGNRANNALANLRDVSRRTNIQNQRKAKPNNASGFLGVAPTVSGRRWTAQVHVGGKKHHLGCFDSPQEAHEAYVAGKRRLHEGCTL
jgi:hypothetical protein